MFRSFLIVSILFMSATSHAEAYGKIIMTCYSNAYFKPGFSLRVNEGVAADGTLIVRYDMTSERGTREVLLGLGARLELSGKEKEYYLIATRGSLQDQENIKQVYTDKANGVYFLGLFTAETVGWNTESANANITSIQILRKNDSFFLSTSQQYSGGTRGFFRLQYSKGKATLTTSGLNLSESISLDYDSCEMFL